MSERVRAIFMGSDSFSIPVLEPLLDDATSEGVEVVGVVTQPDRPAGRGRKLAESPVKTVAREAGTTILQPEKIRDPAAIEAILSLKPDLVVVASYGQIIPRAILDTPRFRALNLHPSLLPKYRGPSPIETAIMDGGGVTGTTLMLMTPRMDAGPILAQRELQIRPEETAGDLSARLSPMSADLLVESLPGWFEGSLKAQPQGDEAATYTHLIAKDEARLDWNDPATVLARKVRALNPWPTAFTYWNERRLRILRAKPGEGKAEPGQVAGESNEGLCIGTAEGLLVATELQLEGGKALRASELLRGHPGLLGATLS